MKAQIVRKVCHVVFLACMLCPVPALAENSYVGTAACKDCHEEQYDNFTKYAKKAHSDKSIKIMASDLTETELAQCYGCHTTGYGKPGGFVSYEKTPHVADAGCEVCHGPGRDHVESGGDTELIKGKLTMEDCQGCHNESRVKAFNFKPLLYGGAH
ncbi:cytochrome c family protein [Desulfomicrobium escambiense]|uniref:cytochrome c family protein n=1 Tax=Desulfomicrobium escambiense TaxID=29503 RepID=UPI0003F80852